jgi:S1-C subfamily serine protease
VFPTLSRPVSSAAAILATAAVACSAALVGGSHGVGLGVARASTLASVETGVVDVDTALAYEQETAAGTGIVLTGSGEVLTNNHVIRGATRIRVRDVITGRTYSARVLGYSVSSDVALLKLQGASGLRTAAIGNSSAVRLRQPVTAVGNAGGVGGRPTVTAGKITAVNSAITVSDGKGSSQRLTGLIGTDASVQPGDSGGPLLSSSGRVLGILTAAASGFEFRSTGNAGYAIPINRALAIAHQIESRRSSSTVHVGPTAFLGVLTRADNPGFGEGVRGALVEAVVPGTAAARIGLRPGDLLTFFDGHGILSPRALTNLVLSVAPGAKVQVRWIDGVGGSHAATVRLGSGPPQ